ncbi:PTS lactose/cellobiose transporter subunit IIA [Clostridium sp. chh4-2]|uniref:PTS lactose/cellobiose transporter subunit IIA n=1 Tax=Clostridium sp. chh4-2 TaxID=2067550 RepID=UPI000CCE36FB|nr:PTS lactose/cellobiose transporter subunit IIA [Clostridium sp. chh4-2]PNV59360.1 PTS lactose/cellobiose transporter subunit IIA [Clostridium sp. chh4-2]
MDTNQELIVMELVVNAGEGRSFAMEALKAARTGDFEKAGQLVKQSEQAIQNAHRSQIDIISKEAGGEPFPMSLLMVHAQDHVMTAMTVLELAKEMIQMYQMIQKKGE